MELTVPALERKPNVPQGTPDASVSKIEVLYSPRLIRTMKSDAAEAIKKQNETSVSIAMAEDRKRAQEAAKEIPAQGTVVAVAPKRIGRIFIIGGIVLVGTAAVLAYIFVLPQLKNITIPSAPVSFFAKPTEPTPLLVAPKVRQITSSLVPAQSEKHFNITKEASAQVLAGIATERGLGNLASSIKLLSFTEESASGPAEISAARFISFTNIQAPEIITRSLEKPFMVGFFGETNGGATPFLVLKVSRDDTGLAGMLEWESGLPRLFDTLFGTHLVDSLPSNLKFQDIVVSGKDARILEIGPGSTVAYAFANSNTLVIAESKTALEALLLLAAKN